MTGDKHHQPLPHNLEAEQALLGAVLVNNEALALVAAIVQPPHFFEGAHARIYEVAGKKIAAGELVSPVTLAEYFTNDETLSDIGGPVYLARLASAATTIINAPEYARVIRKAAEAREVIAVSGELIAAAYEPHVDEDLHKTIADGISSFSSIIEGNATKRKTSFTLEEAGVSAIDQLARIMQGGNDENAIPTGLSDLDETLGGGMRRGEFIIGAARPGMGKTAVAIQVAMNVSEAGGGVGYFSLEMPSPSLMNRIQSAKVWTPESPIEYSRIGGAKISDDEFRWLASATREVSGWPLIIDDRPGLAPSEIEAMARVISAKFERAGKSLDLLVVDHLHKCRFPGATSRVAEYSEVSGRLAEIGKRLNCPVLALAQLNRGVESRDDKRPTLADLRESGSIEQDADAVMFFYREHYYKSREKDRCRSIEHEVDLMAELEQWQNSLEIIIGKQRNGPTGTVNVWCDMPSNVVLSEPQNQSWSNAA